MINFFKTLCYIPFVVLVLCSCSASKNIATPQKYAPHQLQQDYHLFKNILQDVHPGLYWYTPKDSINYYFAVGEKKLQDSLTEAGFRSVLGYVLEKIKCGHTTVKPSKAYVKKMRNSSRFFPLVVKAWPDTFVVTQNLNPLDRSITKGAILTAIDNRPITAIADTMFQHLSADGYNLTHKYQIISNRGVFGSVYSSLYGYQPKYKINFIDTAGNEQTATIPLYVVKKDSTRRMRPVPSPSPRERRLMRLKNSRSLWFDTSINAAFMDINTFGKEYRIKRFLRQSFRQIKSKQPQNLVIDLRGNGGGSVTNSNLLTRYLATKPFKIADSIYALKRSTPYYRYRQDKISNWMFLFLFTHRKKDGYYHFTFYENKYFKLKKKNHYNGQVYVLTGGNTFSASTLFLQAIKGQPNVTVVGEETGGGAYGSNAWLIPDVTLPVTKVRFRLPLFRLVVDKDLPKNGRGIMPDIVVPPTVEDIRNNQDFKMNKVIELIKDSSNQH